MNWFKRIPLWGIASGCLLVLAVLFRFVLRGYAYTAYTLAFIAALIIMHRFFSRPLWRIVVILVCIGLVYFVIVEIPIVKNARTDAEPERDYLIVLGAAVYGDEPSPSLEHRLQGALEYLQQYPDSTAIVSGGKGPGEDVTEAQCMFDWLTAKGIAAERIIMENKATSTKENLLFSFEIIRELGGEPEGNVAVLSSPYHLFRAKEMTKLLGVEVTGVAGKPDRPLLMVNYFIREAFGVTHLWVFGW